MTGAFMLVLMLFATPSASSASPALEWVKQIGTIANDMAEGGVSADAVGNVFVSGGTGGSLQGTNQGYSDAYLSNYNSSGDLLWTRQFGTPLYDECFGVSADGLGNAYAVGEIGEDPAGGLDGNVDAFVTKYDGAGNLGWIRQFGTNIQDFAEGVSADSQRGIYVTGSTRGNLGAANRGSLDAFISRFSSTGDLQWAHQVGTSGNDYFEAVATDHLGNAFTAGSTFGSLSGSNAGSDDAIVAKYTENGSLQWIRQFGTTGGERCLGIVVDKIGNVYVDGVTDGILAGAGFGDADAFIAKYDTSGNRVWIRQFGTGQSDAARGIALDQFGNVIVGGTTGGNLGTVNYGSGDVFLTKFDPSGNLIWLSQYGTGAFDATFGISSDGNGNIYAAGFTEGGFGGPFAGGSADGFVLKLHDVPEPSCFLIATIAIVTWLVSRSQMLRGALNDELKYSLLSLLRNTSANARTNQELAADGVSTLANPGFSHLLRVVAGRDYWKKL